MVLFLFSLSQPTNQNAARVSFTVGMDFKNLETLKNSWFLPEGIIIKV